MNRHPIDQRTPTDGGRLRAFYAIASKGEDDDAPGRVSRSLHERPTTRDGFSRLGAYLRIARGRTT